MNMDLYQRSGGYRTAFAAFVVGLVLGFAVREISPSAHAQPFNPAAQRMDIGQGIAQLNAKTAEVLAVLRTGTLKVRVVETDKSSGAGPRLPLGPVLVTEPGGRQRDPESEKSAK